MHVHHGEAEAFYVLDGTVELTCGDQTVTVHAGDFAYTPKHVPHKFVVAGDKPARILLLFSSPGFERFFAEGGSSLDQPAVPPNPAPIIAKPGGNRDWALVPQQRANSEVANSE